MSNNSKQLNLSINHFSPSLSPKNKEITVTWQGEIVADSFQSTFSPTGERTKLANNAFAFCSLDTL